MVFTDPDVAVIVTVPSATEVTRPDEETVAIDALDEIQVTLAPFIVTPFWSLTVAVSCDVSPNASRLTLVGNTVIDVAKGAVVLFPQACKCFRGFLLRQSGRPDSNCSLGWVEL